MNSKQLLSLIVIGLVVVILGAVVYRGKTSSWSSSPGGAAGAVLLPDFPLNDVQSIVITQKKDTLELRKKDDKWRVAQRDDYPANFESISSFLQNLAELKATQPMQVGASQYGRLDLLAPDKGDNSGVEVKFHGAGGKLLASVILGKEYRKGGDEGGDMMGYGGGGYASGRYVLECGKQKVALVSNAFSSIVPKPLDWLDKDFLKVADMKGASLTTGGKEAWSLSRDKAADEMTLAGLAAGDEADSTKTRAVAGALSWASFNDVLGKSKADDKGPADKLSTFKASDFDGFAYTLTIGAANAEQKYPVSVAVAYEPPKERVADKDEKPEDKAKKDADFKKKLDDNQKKAAELKGKLEGWTFLMDKYSIDNMVKERKDLLKEKPKPEDAKPSTDAPGAPPMGEMMPPAPVPAAAAQKPAAPVAVPPPPPPPPPPVVEKKDAAPAAPTPAPAK